MNKSTSLGSKGFTLTELLIVIGLVIILFTFSSISLIGSVRRPAQAGVFDVLVSDVRSQQLKAMTGKEGEYGINFSETSYTLTPDNFVVNLPSGFRFTTTPSIVFSKVTGEIVDTTVLIEDTQSGKTTEVNINKYGATY